MMDGKRFSFSSHSSRHHSLPPSTSTAVYEASNGKQFDSPSSTHIRPSSMSFNPVGQAHDIRGLLSVIFGAGRHRCEQWPLTAWQKFSPSGCRYGWYTWMVIGCWSCMRRKEKSINFHFVGELIRSPLTMWRAVTGSTSFPLNLLARNTASLSQSVQYTQSSKVVIEKGWRSVSVEWRTTLRPVPS